MDDYASEQASEVEALDSIYYTDMESMFSPASQSMAEKYNLFYCNFMVNLYVGYSDRHRTIPQVRDINKVGTVRRG